MWTKLVGALTLFMTTCAAGRVTSNVPLVLVPNDVVSAPALVVPTDTEIEHKKILAYLDFEITPESAAPLIKLFREAERNQQILLIINSPGGEIDAGNSLSSSIKHSNAAVTCVVEGRASSYALVVLQACDARGITPGSLVMIHQASSAVEGTSSDMRSAAGEVDIYTEAMFRTLMVKSKLTIDELKKHTAHGHRWWITSEEAVKLGLADAVVKQ
jgi:ATP-dependent protease ClpP protease subunit